MQNERRAAIRFEAKRLEKYFIASGALLLEADSLLSAETLLDLYGEDIRARAYVTNDPVMGERMMRPDFTVPIVERHMSEGAEPARYCYNGPVWRMQDAGSKRETEFIQVGFEVFDRSNSANSDAEVFSIFNDILPTNLQISTGDIGLLQSAVIGLNTTNLRKAALMRHLWRPLRFQNLMELYSKNRYPEGEKVTLSKYSNQDIEKNIKNAGKFIGLRTEVEVNSRILSLQEDAKTSPISFEEADVINKILNLKTTASEALLVLKEFVKIIPNLEKAVSGFEARLGALQVRKVNVEKLPFEGSYGLTSMEYYDGFVFSFSDGETIIASGGRYDALTAVLGSGKEIPAVGGVIRPDALIKEF
tara:strand:+ start:12003 stop:13085 length:1083 start_codon:yes stop_codon:yes gene_type:complete